MQNFLREKEEEASEKIKLHRHIRNLHSVLRQAASFAGGETSTDPPPQALMAPEKFGSTTAAANSWFCYQHSPARFREFNVHLTAEEVNIKNYLAALNLGFQPENILK